MEYLLSKGYQVPSISYAGKLGKEISGKIKFQHNKTG